ncbi:MAG: hypothetical protein PHR35_22545 [Kiritimatiellae bacterium]|nr:hypothetical protein [Kiritimatiellia bacterium]
MRGFASTSAKPLTGPSLPSSTGEMRSPFPSMTTAPPCTMAGTSHPSSPPSPIRASRVSFRSQSRLSPTSTPAASALPPPSPPPMGMRLTMRMRTPPQLGFRRCRTNCTARHARLRGAGQRADRSTSSEATSKPSSDASSSSTRSHSPSGISRLRSS